MPADLVFAFPEDGTLEVFENAAAAATEYEGVDVECGTVSFYLRDGTPLVPIFVAPNRTGKLFGLFSWVQSGRYNLAPSYDAAGDSFALALFGASTLEPNPWFSSLAELKAVLAREGVEVEWRPGFERKT